MVQIVSEPYVKTFVFPYASFTFFARICLLVLTIVAPFFIVYKTGHFYQTSKTSYVDLSQVNLKPTYEYFVNLKTSKQSYVFTNMFTNDAYQSLNIKFTQKPNEKLQVQIQYPKSITEKVKEVELHLSFDYSNYNKTSYSVVKANLKGYDLAQAAVVGFIEFKDGIGDTPVLKSDNILKSSQYNFLSVYEKLYKSSSYLSYRFNSVPLSMPSELFRLNLVFNYPLVKIQEQTPSILGQIIWSWIQYFPIFFVFYLATDYVWVHILKEKLVKNTLKHDKDYLQIVRKQQDIQKGHSNRYH